MVKKLRIFSSFTAVYKEKNITILTLFSYKSNFIGFFINTDYVNDFLNRF